MSPGRGSALPRAFSCADGTGEGQAMHPGSPNGRFCAPKNPGKTGSFSPYTRGNAQTHAAQGLPGGRGA